MYFDILEINKLQPQKPCLNGIAKGNSPFQLEKAGIEAGRYMLKRILWRLKTN